MSQATSRNKTTQKCLAITTSESKKNVLLHETIADPQTPASNTHDMYNYASHKHGSSILQNSAV
jgi:hypothetical protein